MIEQNAILYEKALERLASLEASYESGMISAEAFRVSVETVWAVLGGVLDTPEFTELMTEANQVVARLPSPVARLVFRKGTSMAVLERVGEQVRLRTAAQVSEKQWDHDMPDQAARHMMDLSSQVMAKGFE